MSTQRVKYIDVFRGIGIIMMIMGHIGFGNAFIHFVHAFHMPMFFWVSGFFFSTKHSWRSFISKKLKTLVLPYFLSGILFVILWMLEYCNYDLFPVHLKGVLTVNSESIPYGGSIWFLMALFWAEVIYWFVNRINKRCLFQNLLVILLAFTGNVYGKYLPFALGPGLVGVGFLHVGKIFFTSNKKVFVYIRRLGGIPCFIICIIEIILIFLNGYVSMRTSSYSNIPLFWVNAIATSLVGLNICRILENNKIVHKTIMIIEKIGKDSIVYLCFNQIVIHFLNKEICSIDMSQVLVWGMELLATLIVLYIVNMIIMNTPLKRALGR